MPNCIACGRPTMAAHVIDSECYDAVARYKKLYIEMLKQYDEGVCDKCANKVSVVCGEDCPGYEYGHTAYIDGEKVNVLWTCEDFDFGSCKILENTPCNKCI